MNSTEVVCVVADDRERNSGVIEVLRKRGDVDVAVRRLSVGDYLVNDNLLFERKAFADFSHSIMDGRLFRQCVGLLGSAWQAAMILEGTTEDVKRIKVPRKTVQGALIHLCLTLGIPILRSTGAEETAWLLATAGRQILNVGEGNVTRHGISRARGKRRRQLLLLQGLPGVGRKRAKVLLDHFDTVRDVMNADYDQLRAVDGIGDHVADQIRHAVNEERATYGVAEKRIGERGVDKFDVLQDFN